MKVRKDWGNYIYWMEQRRRGRSEVFSRLQFLREAQSWSVEKSRNYQLERLRSLVSHSYETVPFYKKVMDQEGIKPSDISSPSDLSKIPVLTRKILMEEGDNLISNRADKATLKANFSSGSTGFRASFHQDQDFRMWMRAHQLRTYEWCSNWSLGDPFILLWGSEIYWSFKSLLDYLDNALTNRREFNTFCLSNGLIDNFIKKILSYDPVLISSYSNAMHLLAKRVAELGVQFEGLRAIQATSEPLPPSFRENLMKVFNCEVFDKYGMRETNIISHESPVHDGMLIQTENVYIEFVNSAGVPCSYGEEGKIVVTCLNNFSAPLIRYETSDLACAIDGGSSCGFPYPRMSAVKGRQQDLICNPGGGWIDAYFFSYLFMRFPEIHWFQVVQEVEDELQINLYAPRGISSDTRTHLQEQIIQHTKFEFLIRFNILDAMPASPTGKFRLCVSKLADRIEDQRSDL